MHECWKYISFAFLFYYWMALYKASKMGGAVLFASFLFLALDLANHENTLFSLAALQNYSVQFLALLSFVCFVREGWRWHMISFICAFLATFSCGAGVLVWPVLFFIFFKRNVLCVDESKYAFQNVMHRIDRFKSGSFLCLVVSAAVSLGIFFHGFRDAAAANVKALEKFGILPIHDGVWDKISYVITACGGIVPNQPVAFVLGLIVIAMGCFVLFNIRRVKDDAILCLAAFEFAICLSGALFRSKYGGGGMALMLRYLIISYSLIATVAYLFLSLIGERYKELFGKLSWCAFFGCVFINFTMLFVGWELLQTRTFCLEDGIRMNVPAERNAGRSEYSRVLEYKDILEEAERQGIWHLH